MRKILLALASLLATTTTSAQFVPDVLGTPFQCTTLKMADSYDGETVATLVRHRPLVGVTRAILYIHGYNDYFFQREMAEKFVEQGWQFYALDLRRYGRSMREWHEPFRVQSIDEYYEEIDASIAMMREEGIEEIVLMGHSTGGLITSLYCNDRRDNLPVEALILNSPFFDMNLGGFTEAIVVPFVSTMGKPIPDWTIQKGSDNKSGYGASISDEWDGEWDFDTQFKRIESLPITAEWIRAIHKGQKRLQKGLDVPCPVLVLYSDKSIKAPYDKELFKTGDSVLDVEDIAEYAPCIGAKVSQHEVAGGMHDLFLSVKEVREPLYTTVFEWLGSIE